MEQCPAHSGIESEIKMLKESDKLQWVAIDKVMNRLPAWGTIIISLLTFLLGASVTYASMAIKIAEIAHNP